MASVRRDVIVVGASAGGVEALRALVSGLPPDLPAAILVVLHMPAGGTSALAAILDRAGPLPAVTATIGMHVEHGTIYVGPPDRHLLLVDGRIVLVSWPAESGHRPSINALFSSSATAVGPRAIGVMLSGVLDDGVAGLGKITECGGLVVVQDPADALHPEMPIGALRQLHPCYVVRASDMGGLLLSRLVRETVGEAGYPESPEDDARMRTLAVRRDWHRG